MGTGPTNPQLQGLIAKLREASFKNQGNLWLRVAEDLSKPTRQRRVVNLSRLSRYTEQGDVVIVPGKVLASGDMDHKLTIAAYQFSQGAKEKVHQAKGETLTIEALMAKKVDFQKVKIIG